MTIDVKTRPILFNGEMVRAILDGRKTMTRRVQQGGEVLHCPYGARGERLWVRETWAVHPDGPHEGILYRATDPGWDDNDTGLKWKPSIFMTRDYSRITLEITDVRVQRLNDISEEDAIAEGVTVKPDAHIAARLANDTPARMEFWALWRSINGDESWVQNPWVWAISFRRIES